MGTDLNQVVMVGRLTRDAELRYTPAGKANATFAIAVNRRTKRGDEWTEEASFFDVIVWDKIAESLAKYLLKGSQVAIAGELRQERWEKDGQKHSRVQIVSDAIQLLGGKRDDHSTTTARQADGARPERTLNRDTDPSFFEDDIPF